MKYLTNIGERTYIVDINQDGEVLLDGERRALDLRNIDDAGSPCCSTTNHLKRWWKRVMANTAC